jgi:hypothetical protein
MLEALSFRGGVKKAVGTGQSRPRLFIMIVKLEALRAAFQIEPAALNNLREEDAGTAGYYVQVLQAVSKHLDQIEDKVPGDLWWKTVSDGSRRR